MPRSAQLANGRPQIAAVASTSLPRTLTATRPRSAEHRCLRRFSCWPAGPALVFMQPVVHAWSRPPPHTTNGAISTPSLSLVEPRLNAQEAAQVLGGIPSKTVLQLAREGRLRSLRNRPPRSLRTLRARSDHRPTPQHLTEVSRRARTVGQRVLAGNIPVFLDVFRQIAASETSGSISATFCGFLLLRGTFLVPDPGSSLTLTKRERYIAFSLRDTVYPEWECGRVVKSAGPGVRSAGGGSTREDLPEEMLWV